MESHHIDCSDVSVEVRGGKVALEGSVPRRHMKHAIEDLVDACPRRAGHRQPGASGQLFDQSDLKIASGPGIAGECANQRGYRHRWQHRHQWVFGPTFQRYAVTAVARQRRGGGYQRLPEGRPAKERDARAKRRAAPLLLRASATRV